MTFLIVLLVVFLFFISGSSTEAEKKVCHPHKWVYKKQPGVEQIEYLQCKSCDAFPGRNTEE